MTEWYPITAKFTSEEKRILDILRDVYGLNYNQSLKAGIEFLSRIIGVVEYSTMSDSKIFKKIQRITKKYNRLMEDEIKKAVKEFPKEQQEEEYEKFLAGRDKLFLQFDKTFDKNRKRGRKSLKKERGRPSTRL